MDTPFRLREICFAKGVLDMAKFEIGDGMECFVMDIWKRIE